MSRRKIITNNPYVANYCGFGHDDEFISGDASSVIIRCRDLVHKGWRLLNHPLAGSLKPGENPYRTLLLEEGDSLDFESLSLIEAAIETSQKFEPRWAGLLSTGRSVQSPEVEKIMDDFKVIDFSLFKSAVEG